MASADAAVSALINRFEKRSPRARLACADETRAELEGMDLSERVKDKLWIEVFVPLVGRAEREAAEQAEAVRANAGAVVLRGVMDLVSRHPKKLSRDALAKVLVGAGAVGSDDPSWGVAAGVPGATVLKVLDQLVAKGLLAETGGKLERVKRPAAA